VTPLIRVSWKRPAFWNGTEINKMGKEVIPAILWNESAFLKHFSGEGVELFIMSEHDFFVTIKISHYAC
jgi:hypothetical protein